MGESYEQGIEKAADEIVAHYLNVTVTTRNAKQIGVAAVEAFLAARPTIRWCEEHGHCPTAGSSSCLFKEWGDSLGVEYTPCRIAEVRIVERETP